MDKSVYSTEKISTGLAVSLETDQSSTRQFTILIRYLGAFDSLQEIAVFPIVPLLNRFAVGTASKEEILRLAYMPEVLYIDLTRQMEYEQAVQAEDRIAACFPMYDEQESVLRGNGILIGIVDSGLEFMHPALITQDGKNRNPMDLVQNILRTRFNLLFQKERIAAMIQVDMEPQSQVS